jgi:E3 ubiquitin-protein ligase MGRN1
VPRITRRRRRRAAPGPAPRQPPPGAFGAPPSAAGFGQPPQPPPPPAVETQTYHQTATVKNQVNLKKGSLKVEPVAGRPHDFKLSFTFDATAPCR